MARLREKTENVHIVTTATVVAVDTTIFKVQNDTGAPLK